METSLIGLIGVLVGILLSEYFRRRNRIEVYSQKVFERRLEIHEGLLKRMGMARTIADEVMTNNELKEEERRELISTAVLSVAGYVDENPLYIDAYVGADSVAVFIGVEDVQSIKDDTERDAAIAKFRKRFKSTCQTLIKESGVHEINKHFRLITHSKPESPMINRIKELERNRGRKS